MTITFAPFDPAEYLKSDEAILAFLSEAFSSRDPQHIADAFGIAAKAKGMSDIARQTALSQECLYRSLSDKGNPTLQTVIAVLNTLGIDLTVCARPSSAS